MKTILVEALLAGGGLAAVLATLAFLRLKTALDRLHCASFVMVATGFAVTAAAIVQDGVTSRSWKVAALFVLSLLVGAVTTHALGRALHLREGPNA